jgi:tRNA-Thr(GGU) m(6)t(6)A37 methyltransferase TsaA
VPRQRDVAGNWALVDSEIHLEPQYAPGLQELDGFSHVLVVFFSIERRVSIRKSSCCGDRAAWRTCTTSACFAQRTKYRPNPIGVTAVKLLAIEGNVVKVRGLDALDGTPVLDIKPYIPPFDRVDDVKMPPWVGHVMEGYF